MHISPRAPARLLRASVLLLVVPSLLVTGSTAPIHSTTARAQTQVQPNIILIITDDQRLDSLAMMPQVQRLLVRRGMSLRTAIVTNPICCPSRATILTGRYSHTTGVYTNASPDGGWEVFRSSEADTIATALQSEGYRTGFVGKYLNGYESGSASLYVPPGWDRWFAYSSLNPGYYDYSVYDDGLGSVTYGSTARDYSTDVFRRQATQFIRSVPDGTPFFLVVAPKAPHAPFVAAPRHEGDLDGASVRLNAAVNEADVSDKPAHIRAKGTGTKSEIRQMTRDQWEALLAVDDIVARIHATLQDTDRALDTLMIFTSDNGLSNREHRWSRKQVPYEEAIRVPLIVRFPGRIRGGAVSEALVSNVDIAPTIADFAGATMSTDGLSLRPLLTETASLVRKRVVLEHVRWITHVPTYCGVRTPFFTFVHYETGEEELYDLGRDPRQLLNVVTTRPLKAEQLRTMAQRLCDPTPPGFVW